MKKGYLQKFWNGGHLEEEEMEDIEIHGCMKLTTGTREKQTNNIELIDRKEQRKKIKLQTQKDVNIDTLSVNK